MMLLSLADVLPLSRLLVTKLGRRAVYGANKHVGNIDIDAALITQMLVSLFSAAVGAHGILHLLLSGRLLQ
jgi:hypothetical protein